MQSLTLLADAAPAHATRQPHPRRFPAGSSIVAPCGALLGIVVACSDCFAPAEQHAQAGSPGACWFESLSGPNEPYSIAACNRIQPPSNLSLYHGCTLWHTCAVHIPGAALGIQLVLPLSAWGV